MKDIVAESAPTYVSIYPGSSQTKHTAEPHSPKSANFIPTGESEQKEDGHEGHSTEHGERAFSLARFIPLLSERVYVISPYTRMHLVSWLMVLDSIPDLELVAWLPEFLDGLL